MRGKVIVVRLAGFMVVVVFVLRLWPTAESGQLEVVMLDIGQGDAMLIRTPAGSDILVDGGPDASVLEALARHLPPADRTIELVILTHPDLDHVGGLPDVAKHFHIERVVETPRRTNSLADRLWEEAIAGQGSEIVNVQSGDRLTIDGVMLSFVWPEAGVDVSTLETNDSSVVTLLTYGTDDFLLTGDMGTAVEARLSELRALRPVEVVKVPHHGSISSSSEELLSTTRPAFALISVGAENAFGHPHPAVVRRYERLGAKIFRTDRDGDIMCISRGHGVSCTP